VAQKFAYSQDTKISYILADEKRAFLEVFSSAFSLLFFFERFFGSPPPS